MSDQPTSKPMAMLLQDPYWLDDKGEYLHRDYPFPLDQDFLVGTGSSKFIVRDSPKWDTGLLDWGGSATGLGYEDLKESASLRSFRSIVDDPQFRQVNSFAVASHTLHNIEEALGREITWRNGRPLEIRPHASLNDSHYDSFSLSLSFGSSTVRYGGKYERIWHCLSHDVLTHETAHAIFDSVRPLFVYSAEIDTDALHESISDLLALSGKLEHPTVVERLYGDLRDNGGVIAPCANFLYMSPRNPGGAHTSAERNIYSLPLVYSRSYLHPANLIHQHYDPQEPKEPHARSAVWTAAICDILDELLKKTLVSGETETRNGNSDDFTQAVVDAAYRIRGALLRALHYVPLSSVTMPLLARLFCKADERFSPEDSTIRDIAKRVFEKRGLMASDIRYDRAPPDIGQTWVDNFEKAVKKGETSLLTRMVIQQAKDLRIPLDKRLRILTPRLIRANREIYLYFVYELVDTIDAPIYEQQRERLCWDPTGKAERVRVPSYYGGTVIVDENFEKPGILVTDPPAGRAGTQEVAPALPPARFTEDRFKVITSDLGYLLRHIEGRYKPPGFAGFDWPEFDG